MVTVSYSNVGYVPGLVAVLPSTRSLIAPTGADARRNCPCALVCTEGKELITLLLEVKRFFSTARIVTPGMGTLVLSRTTPLIMVFAGFPAARPEAVKLAGKP